MLMALNEDNRLVMADYLIEKKQPFTCPACHSNVTLRRGNIKAPYFAHERDASCQALLENESELHVKGKLGLQTFLTSESGRPELEVYLSGVQQRPDLLMTFEGNKIAVEFQCSPLGLQRHLERNCGYRQSDLTVMWILGETYLRRKMTVEKIGQFAYYKATIGLHLLFWRAQTAILEVHYQIRVNSGEEVTWRVARFKAFTDFQEWRKQSQLSIMDSRLTTAAISKVQRRITYGIVRANPKSIRLQNNFYLHGMSLHQIPVWLWGTYEQLPLLREPAIVFAMLVWLNMKATSLDCMTTEAYLKCCWSAIEQLGGPIHFPQIQHAKTLYHQLFFYLWQHLQKSRD